MHNYTHTKAKSHQAEVKMNMANIYNLEKSFYSEYGAYIPDLEAIGWQKGGGAGLDGTKILYAAGWLCCTSWAGSVTGLNLGSYMASICQGPTSNNNLDATNCQNLCTTAGYLPDLNAAPNSGANPQGFSVGGAGLIYSGSVCDLWRMDNSRRLQNIQVGY